MDFVKMVHEKAVKAGKTIVLPEGCEPRTVKAATIITKDKLAKVILVGNEADILKTAQKENVSLDGIKIVEPLKSEWYQDFVSTFYEMRKNKGVDMGRAAEIMKDEPKSFDSDLNSRKMV